MRLRSTGRLPVTDNVLRVPYPLANWQELNRRSRDLSQDVLAVIAIIGRMSAYGGMAIDSTSAPYVGGPTVITNWGFVYPGDNGDDILNVTVDPVAGTISPDLDGVYQASIAVSGDGTAGSFYTLDLYENGIRLIGFNVDQSNQSAAWTISFSFLLDLVAGAVIDVRITAGGATTIEHAVFSIAKTGLVASDIL